MGSPENEGDDDEYPQHPVTVKSFLMGKYPVTQAQWKAVAEFDEVERYLDPEPSNFKGDNLPVEFVTWYDAKEFCQRLSKKTGRKYRLPSEAEWEYACRADTANPFHFGETITTDLANYKGVDWDFGGTIYLGFYGNGPRGESREKTTPVGSFKVANNFGLYDMHGNVWEWCLDHWHDSYQDAPSEGGAWLTGGDASLRVIRGGGWFHPPVDCRSANRSWLDPNLKYGVGLRVVSVSTRALS